MNENVLDIKENYDFHNLPIWIKVFSYLFLVIQIMLPVSIVMSFLDYPTNLSFYGLSSNSAFSLNGIFIIAVFMLHGLVAFFLIRNHESAIIVAKIVAIISMTICIGTMVYPFFQDTIYMHFKFRIELIVLVLYYLKLKNIQPKWMKSEQLT